MDALNIININSSLSDIFDEKSFLYQLYEERTWDMDEYYKLEWAIYYLIKNNIYLGHDLYAKLFVLHQMIMQCLHTDEYIKYPIINIKDKHVLMEYVWRFEDIVRCYFTKHLPDASDGDLGGGFINPYLKNLESPNK